MAKEPGGLQCIGLQRDRTERPTLLLLLPWDKRHIQGSSQTCGYPKNRLLMNKVMERPGLDRGSS